MTIPAEAYMKIKHDADNGKLDGQVKSPPRYWITTSQGMSGFFAVMMWDGGGFDEPWQTGDGRYRDHEQAKREARDWAEAEDLEYVE